MYTARPVITPADNASPSEILGLDLIKEFIGLDEDADAAQDRALPVLRQAAIEQGQHITGGLVWQAAGYRIDGLPVPWSRAGILLPLAPVFSVSTVVGMDAEGHSVAIAKDEYSLLPSAIELGRPWAELRPVSDWPDTVCSFSVTCSAGWTEETLPESIKGWLLNRIATLYDQRSDMSADPVSEALLYRWRVAESLYG